MQVPAALEGYEIEGVIGRGGMAEVLLATPRGSNATAPKVAIKRILPHLCRRDDFVRMFDREASIASRLDHPNIARVYDYLRRDRDRFLVMEYVHGRSLTMVLRAASRSGGLAIGVALSIVREIANALQYVHGLVDEDGQPLGIIHRDISPANILIRRDGAVKLVDFGIAKSTRRRRQETLVGGSMKGNLGYMSPEQCRCEGLDHRSDIYSLGVLLYEATLCRRAFRVDNEILTMEKIVQGQFDRPREVDPAYPEALERIVLRLLAPHPGERFDAAADVARELETFAAAHKIPLCTDYVAFEVQRLVPVTEGPGDGFGDRICAPQGTRLTHRSQPGGRTKARPRRRVRLRDGLAALLGAGAAGLMWFLVGGGLASAIPEVTSPSPAPPANDTSSPSD